MEAAEGRKHFVLVHGAGQGAWSWYKVATLLAAAGHKVTAPDLGASGADARALREVGTFEEYIRPLTDAVGALPPGERVVLVGHSHGGLAAAAAMERFPAKIAAAVFVSAFMPDTSSGLSYFLDEYIKKYPMPWMDTRTFAVPLIGSEDDQSQSVACFQFGREFLSTRGYQRCAAEDATLAASLVRPASLYLPDLRRGPPLTEEGYGSVRAFYVVCGEDLTLPKDFQLWMLRHRAGAVALELGGADHVPMMSTPGELSRLLRDVAGACA